jgi:hypothetical protein
VSDRPPPVLVSEGDVRSIVGRDLALVFERVGDRWTHAIEASRSPGSPRETIARAVESDAKRDDAEHIVSPVFQELQFHTGLDNKPGALLVGMSGRHHFSAAFLFDETDAGVTILVDIADRCREEAAYFLASTYAVMLLSGDLTASDEKSIRWSLGTRCLTFTAGNATRAGMAEGGRRATLVQANAEIGLAGPSRRWQYSWSCDDPRPA